MALGFGRSVLDGIIDVSVCRTDEETEDENVFHSASDEEFLVAGVRVFSRLEFSNGSELLDH